MNYAITFIIGALSAYLIGGYVTDFHHEMFQHFGEVLEQVTQGVSSPGGKS